MFAIVTVAGQFAEALANKGVLSVSDAQGILAAIAEELRGDGENNGGKYAKPSQGLCFRRKSY
jgi:hypothetical protein